MNTETILSIAHYVTIIMIAVWMLFTGIGIFLKKEFIHQKILRLGYPTYFIYVLGAAKLIGSAFLLLPFPPLFKTMVFTGATIELLAASVSYYKIGDRFSQWVIPLALLLIVWSAFILWRLHDDIRILQ